jgi:hypothetical protein
MKQAIDLFRGGQLTPRKVDFKFPEVGCGLGV